MLCLRKRKATATSSSSRSFAASPLLPVHRRPVSHLCSAWEAGSTGKGLCAYSKYRKTGDHHTCVLPPGSGREESGRQAGSLTRVPTPSGRAKGSLLRPRESRAKGQGLQVGLPTPRSLRCGEPWLLSLPLTQPNARATNKLVQRKQVQTEGSVLPTAHDQQRFAFLKYLCALAVCMCICVRTYIYMCAHARVYHCMCMFAYVCVVAGMCCACVYMCVCMCVYAHMYQNLKYAPTWLKINRMT